MTPQERHERTVELVRASLLARPPKVPVPAVTRDDIERATGIRR